MRRACRWVNSPRIYRSFKIDDCELVFDCAPTFCFEDKPHAVTSNEKVTLVKLLAEEEDKARADSAATWSRGTHRWA